MTRKQGAGINTGSLFFAKEELKMYRSETEAYRNAIKELHDVRTGLQGTNDKLRAIANETICNLYADNKLTMSLFNANVRSCLDEDDIRQIRQEISGSNQTLKFGNDPMVDKQYQKDLFGDNDVKLEIETDDDMLEALARFYSNYRSGDKTRDDVATSMSSWLLELQELRKMKKNLKRFIKDFTMMNLDETLSTKPSDNIRVRDYRDGRMSVFNAISSKIGTYNLDFYNRDEVE